MLPLVMLVPRVTVPAAAPEPKNAASGVALFQILLAAPVHQFSELVSQIPEPSWAPVSAVLASQVRLAALAAVMASVSDATCRNRRRVGVFISVLICRITGRRRPFPTTTV